MLESLACAEVFLLLSSDDRMGSWGPVTFTVGSSSESDFPMAQFVDVGLKLVHRSIAYMTVVPKVNNPTTILWTASSSEIGELLSISIVLRSHHPFH